MRKGKRKRKKSISNKYTRTFFFLHIVFHIISNTFFRCRFLWHEMLAFWLFCPCVGNIFRMFSLQCFQSLLKTSQWERRKARECWTYENGVVRAYEVCVCDLVWIFANGLLQIRAHTQQPLQWIYTFSSVTCSWWFCLGVDVGSFSLHNLSSCFLHSPSF